MPPRETDEKRFSLSKQTPSANTQDFSSTTQAETKTLNDLKNGRVGESGGQGDVRVMTRKQRNLIEDVWKTIQVPVVCVFGQ